MRMEKDAVVPEYSAGGEPLTPTPSEPSSPEKMMDDPESAALINNINVEDEGLKSKLIPVIKVS
jgi:hypothetical protein